MSTLTQSNHNLTRWTLTSEDIFRTLNQSDNPYDDITDVDDIIGLIEEADAVHALEFFGITVEYSYPTPNYNPHRTPPSLAILSIPNNFDPITSSQVVSTYLTIIDEELIPTDTPPVIVQQAHSYDEHTRPHRGADDGTYDYAGSYPLTIFDFIHLTQHP